MMRNDCVGTSKRGDFYERMAVSVLLRSAKRLLRRASLLNQQSALVRIIFCVMSHEVVE
jgi:hypothetical protein